MVQSTQHNKTTPSFSKCDFVRTISCVCKRFRFCAQELMPLPLPPQLLPTTSSSSVSRRCTLRALTPADLLRKANILSSAPTARSVSSAISFIRRAICAPFLSACSHCLLLIGLSSTPAARSEESPNYEEGGGFRQRQDPSLPLST